MPCKLLESGGDVWKDIRCKVQIPLGADEVFMPHVCRQEWELDIKVYTLPVPILKFMDRKRMPEIVETRPPCPALMRDAAFPQQLTKKIIHRYFAVRAPIPCREKDR